MVLIWLEVAIATRTGKNVRVAMATLSKHIIEYTHR